MIYIKQKQLKIDKPDIDGTIGDPKGMSFLFNFTIFDSQKKITKYEKIIKMQHSLICLLENKSDSETKNLIKCEKIAYQEALNDIIEKIENNQLEKLRKKLDNENPRIDDLEKQPKPDLTLKYEDEPELIRYDLDEIDLKYGEYIELASTEVLLAKIYHILSEKITNKES